MRDIWRRWTEVVAEAEDAFYVVYVSIVDVLWMNFTSSIVSRVQAWMNKESSSAENAKSSH